ncbi:MAG: ABC transporter permease, partial [Dysgonamonadaceae bacterium]|nr:ABC transporter permease [Dysgonamonadaceae bacterium]
MFSHSFKMIWAERKSNAWILAELIIVFSILWFCSGFIYEKGKKYSEPVGFDIKHTYLLQFGLKRGITNDNKGDPETLAQDGLTIFERIKKHPEVEAACFSSGNAYPYSTSYSSRQYLKDTISYVASIRNVSPGFFDVFRIKFQKGKTFDSNEILSEKQVVVSPDRKNKFYDNDILSMEHLSDMELDQNEPLPKKRPETKEEWAQLKFIEVRYPVSGVINKVKRGDFENYERIVFSPFKSQELSDINGWTNISIRVKEHADKDFPAKF